MKIVVIGGSGLIGTGVVQRLRNAGHEVVAASRARGVDLISGRGLAEAFAGADVVVDASNSPSLADADTMAFFTTSTKNQLAAAKAAGVKHFVILSIVGADRLPDSGYMRAKVAQEDLAKAGGVPYSIVRATQFFEFAGWIAKYSARDGVARLPSATLQPIAAEEVMDAVVDVAVHPSLNATIDVAGPEAIPLDAIARQYLAVHPEEAIQVVTDESAGYFGAKMNNASLTPQGEARLEKVRFADWLKR